MSGASQLHRDASDAVRQLPAPEVEALRSMLLAMADVRVVLVKLADRLHNLRTVGALPPATAARLAAYLLPVRPSQYLARLCAHPPNGGLRAVINAQLDDPADGLDPALRRSLLPKALVAALG
jgi:hypothetical protein